MAGCWHYYADKPGAIQIRDAQRFFEAGGTGGVADLAYGIQAGHLIQLRRKRLACWFSAPLATIHSASCRAFVNVVYLASSLKHANTRCVEKKVLSKFGIKPLSNLNRFVE